MKLTKCLLTLAVLLYVVFGYGQHVITGERANTQINGAEIVRSSQHSNLPSYIKFRSGREIDFDDVIYWVKKNLLRSSGTSLKFVSKHKDRFGDIHYKFNQTVDGIGVKFTDWIVHTRKDKVYALNGMLHESIDASVPAISEMQALSAAKTHIGAAIYKWEIPEEEAHVKSEQLSHCDQNGPCLIEDMEDLKRKIAIQKLNCAGHVNNNATYYPKGELIYVPRKGTYSASEYRLTWKFNIYAHEPVSRSEVYVDAVTGEIVLENEIIHEADTPGTAETAYSGTRNIVTDSFSGGYRLRESGRGNGINTYDMNENTTYGSAVDFTDGDNYWNNVNAEQDEVATDAHWGAEMTYDYFLIEHGRNSIDGAGFTLNSYVHYDNNYANAFWDGSRMTYGDGSGGWTALTALDIAGHEIGHGLCNFSADLVYQDESGALNESFSDIWGASIENYARPSNWNWLIGEDIGSALRSMSNPNSEGDPDTYFGTNWAPLGGADNGGVHTNSGIQNHWYYLLTEGGSGTNDNGDSYTVSGQGFTTSSQIAFRNLTVYLTSNSEYADARFYAIQSATDLFGGCSPEVEATTNAWYAVGVGAAYTAVVDADFNAPTTSACSAPFTVDFSNLSTNGVNFNWDFGDGNASSATSPSHIYTSSGTYTVELLVDGGPCGQDSIVIVDYITIDSTLPCITILPTSGTADLQTSCTGTIYDSGGASADYGANEDAQITISPIGASSIDLTFPFFDIEPGSASNCDYDYIEIFDGPNTLSPMIDRYCNDNPPSGTISSSGGSLTIVFHSDPGLELDGFQADWTCVMSTAPPSANFTANFTETCTGNIEFSDLSANGPTSWSWDFGDGSSSTDQNPSHTYTSNGTYTIELTASNVNGSDVNTQVNYIVVNLPAPPIASGDSICEGSSTSLTASGGANMSWFDSAVGGTLIGTGTTYTTPVLSTSTTYFVQEEVEQTPQNVGPIDNSFGGGGYFNGNQHLIFDVYTPVKLVSVWVDAQGGGNRTIELRDNTGTVIQSAVINIPDGESRITLDFDLPVGTNLQLGTLTGSSPSLFRNNSGPSYPYELPGILSITNSSASVAGYYYFFYDWEVQEPNCTSVRTPVEVTVSPVSDATISPTGPFCESDAATILNAATPGGTWSGPGVTDSLFDPITAGIGTHIITYSIPGSCGDTDTESITVTSSLDATITPAGPLCINEPAIQLNAATSGGTWSGAGMTGDQFDPSTAGVGTHEIIYEIVGSCGNSDTTQIEVLNQADATITPQGPFCENDGFVVLTAADSGGIWTGSGVTGNIFDPATAGVGTHTIYYDIAGVCGDSDSTSFVVDFCSGIHDNSTYDAIRLFPNPAQNQVEVEIISGNTLDVSFQMFNSLGQIILEQCLQSQRCTIDISNYGTGVYLIKVRMGNQQITRNLMIH